MTKKKVTKTTKYQDTKFYFDDCPICKAMKGVEDEGRDLNGEELKEAFAKAKEQGTVAGGSMFDKKDNVN